MEMKAVKLLFFRSAQVSQFRIRIPRLGPHHPTHRFSFVFSFFFFRKKWRKEKRKIRFVYAGTLSTLYEPDIVTRR